MPLPPKPKLGSVGWLIRHRRELLDMSQIDLARKMGVVASVVSRWEQNKNQPSRLYRLELAKVLGGIHLDYKRDNTPTQEG